MSARHVSESGNSSEQCLLACPCSVALLVLLNEGIRGSPGQCLASYLLLFHGHYFPPRTQEAWELLLQKHLMEKVIGPLSDPDQGDHPHLPSMCLGVVPSTSKPKDSSSRAPHERRGHSYECKDRSLLRTVCKKRISSPSQSGLCEMSQTEPKEPAPMKTPRSEGKIHKKKGPPILLVTLVPKHKNGRLPVLSECCSKSIVSTTSSI